MRIKNSPPQLDPTHSRGVLVWRYHADGRVTVQKWPRRRPGLLPQVTQDQVAVWDMAQEFVKTPNPYDYALALRDTEGTAFYARDILISAMYGNYVSWPGYGWRFKLAQSIQQGLDTITQTVGALLVRTAEGWFGLVPTHAGDVLTDGGPGAVPSWQPASGGAGGGLFSGLLAAPPPAATWTAVNFGANTQFTDVSGGGVLLTDVGASGDNLRIAARAAPSPPYTRTALVFNTAPYINYNFGGFGWRDSSSGKLTTFSYLGNAFNNANLRAMNWASPTSYAADPVAAVVPNPPSTFIFERLADDGTNVTMSYSSNGQVFTTLYTVAKASGYLGSAGYNELVLMIDQNHAAGARGGLFVPSLK